MKSMKQACPGCEAEMPFPLRRRFHGDSKFVIEIYISCRNCPYEAMIGLSTAEIERLKAMRAKVQGQADRQKSRWGVVSSITADHLRRLDAQIIEKEADVRSN